MPEPQTKLQEILQGNVKPEITPIVFNKEQMDAFKKAFKGQEQPVEKIMAEMIAGETSNQIPGLYDYKSLKDGTAKFFDLSPKSKDLTPAERALDDLQIIQSFSRDTEGNTIKGGDLKQGFFRDILGGYLSAEGAIAGAKFGASKFKYGRGKLLGGGVGFLTGLFGGDTLGQNITKALIGPEPPMLPGMTSEYEMGKTLAGVVSFMHAPYRISKDLDLGTASYLNNLRINKNRNYTGWGPLSQSWKEKNLIAPKSIRLTQTVENVLKGTRDFARNDPRSFLTAEALFGIGAVGGSGFAEEKFEGQTIPKIISETAGGISTTAVGQPFAFFVSKIPKIITIAKNIKNKGFKEGVFDIDTARKNQAVTRMIEILEAGGEDVNEIIKQLESQDFQKLLMDAEGKPIKLTAGTKTGSPGLLAIEAALTKLGSNLTEERLTGSGQAIKALKGVIFALAQMGDQDSLQMAADLAQQAFSAELNDGLTKASLKVVDAFEKIKVGRQLMREAGGISLTSGRVVTDSLIPTNIQLATTLHDTFNSSLKDARKQESALWKAIPNVTIYKFGKNEDPTNTLNFIKLFDNEFGTGAPKEYFDYYASKLPELFQFIKRKKQELGLPLGYLDDSTDAAQTRLANVSTDFNINQYDKIVDMMKGTPEEVRRKFVQNMAREPEEVINPNAPTIENVLTIIETQLGRILPKDRKRKNELLAAKKYALALRNVDTSQNLSNIPSGASGTATITSQELVYMRKLMLSKARDLGSGVTPSKDAGGFAGIMSQALLEDLAEAPAGPGQDNWRIAYDIARAYSTALNDVFTRSVVGDNLIKTGRGDYRQLPELLGKRLLMGGSDPSFLRIQQINDIAKFAKDQNFPNAEETAQSINGTLEMILQQAAIESFDTTSGEVDGKKLSKFLKNNESLLNIFPDLYKDLMNLDKAKILLDQTTELNKKRKIKAENESVLYKLINVTEIDGKQFGTQSPSLVISRILSPGNDKKIFKLDEVLDVINKTEDESLKEKAMSGLKSSILSYVEDRAGKNVNNLDPEVYYNTLFNDMKGHNVSLSEWMESSGVITKNETKNLKTLLQQMTKFQELERIGGLSGELIEKTGPIIDFYLAIVGSALGTASQRFIMGGQGGPGQLVAAGKGAQTMRTLFDKLPASVKTDVMTELMQNPSMLATFLRKPRSEREATNITNRIVNFLVQLGIRPIRLEIPTLVKETLEEEITPEEAVEQKKQEVRPLDTSQYLPKELFRPNIDTNVASANVPQTQPMPAPSPTVAQGPVDRQRYAAMFPNDFASSLIRSQGGIGSLG
jgi:hypothetical protein